MVRVCLASLAFAACGLPAAAAEAPLPLNMNLDRVVLPPESDRRLVKILMIGDSQMGQSSHRLAGQVQKWDVDFVGRMLMCEIQGGAGIHFSSVTGPNYGADLESLRIPLGSDHGDGNTGSHFHHSRRFTASGQIQPDGSTLGSIGMSAGAYTRTPDFDARKNARVGVYDRPGGFTRFGLRAMRGPAVGESVDLGHADDPGPTLTGAGVVRWFHHAVPPAGQMGIAGRVPVGVVIQDSDGQDADRSLHLVGVLLHDSPQGTDFPDSGLVVSHVSQAGWSAYDHLHTLNRDAIDAVIEMNEGLDTVLVMLGHNREDDFHAVNNPRAYPDNLLELTQRISARHAALGFAAPTYLMVAPWPLGTDSQNLRLAQQTADLHALCQQEGFGFINLFDFFGRTTLMGEMSTPRGVFTYTMDAARTHPADAPTASNLMQDIEWNFDPRNRPCPADMTGDGSVDVFDLMEFLTRFANEDPATDLVAPFGTPDVFDVLAFADRYAAGCP